MKNITASLLHTAWTEEEKLQLDRTINFVEEYDGRDFLTVACQYLYRILNIDHIHLGLIKNKASKEYIYTVVSLYCGQVTSNICYSLNKSPLKHIYDEEFMYLPFGLSAMYPEYNFLRKKNFESYIGMPLLNADDKPLGIMVLLHSRIIERGGFVEALINALVPRIEIELSSKQIHHSYSLAPSYQSSQKNIML